MTVNPNSISSETVKAPMTIVYCPFIKKLLYVIDEMLMVVQHHLFPQVLISRGLQLEGQVVTEEQDLQVMVMTSQKDSPIKYLHASSMQDRVRAAVAQSQASHLL